MGGPGHYKKMLMGGPSPSAPHYESRPWMEGLVHFLLFPVESPSMHVPVLIRVKIGAMLPFRRIIGLFPLMTGGIAMRSVER